MKSLPKCVHPMLLVFGGLLLAKGAVWAVEAGEPTAVIVDDEEEKTPLHEAMLRVRDGVTKIRRPLRDPKKKEKTLGYVQQIQIASVESKAMIPAMTPSVAEPEREAFVKGYRVEMIAFLQATLDLEAAVLEEDVEAAKKHYKQLKLMEKSGHESFVEGD